MQEIVQLMNELCVRFPMIAAHNATSAFAIAAPEARFDTPAAAYSAAQSPVALYHLSTGTKTHDLMLDASHGGGPNRVLNPLAPIRQVRLCPHGFGGLASGLPVPASGGRAQRQHSLRIGVASQTQRVGQLGECHRLRCAAGRRRVSVARTQTTQTALLQERRLHCCKNTDYTVARTQTTPLHGHRLHCCARRHRVIVVRTCVVRTCVVRTSEP